MNHLVLQSTAAVVPCRLGIDEAPYLPPSAVTATVYDADGAELVAAASQTIGSWTLSGAHAAGARTITIASGWGTRPPQKGNTLLYAAATSPEMAPRELVTIESVASSTTATAREDRENAWTTAHRLYDTVQRVALTSTHTATLGRNLRVRLAVTLSGLPAAEAVRYVDTLFDVVAHLPRRPLSLSDFRARAGTIASDTRGRAASSEGGWDQRIDDAWSRVLDDVWGRGVWVDLLVADSQLCEALYWRTLLDAAHQARPAEWSAEGWHEICASSYKDAIRQAFDSIKWLDEDQDLVPDTAEQGRRISDTWLSL